MNVKLLTEHNLEFLSLKVGCTGSSESTLVKMPHCWKSHVTAHLYYFSMKDFIVDDDEISSESDDSAFYIRETRKLEDAKPVQR